MVRPMSQKQSGARRLRVAMVVTGFPHGAEPARGRFNLHAAQSLAHLVDLTVVFLRAWLPGRSAVRVAHYEGVRVVTIAVPRLPGDEQVNLVLYRWLGWRLLRSLLRGCDLIHSVDAAGAGIPASAWARRARVRHVAQVIGSDVNAILPRLRTRASVAGWDRILHGVACNSRALAGAFQALYPHTRNVWTVYRGVDLERFHPTGPATGPLADRPPVRFLFLGGFTPYPALPHRANTKGGETMLAAWKAAEDSLIASGASLMVAGPRADTEFVNRWRARLRRPDQVSLSGALPPERVPALIRSADVVMVPSMEEGLPNVGVESSACARAIFGSDVGGIPEVVVHEQTGLLLPAGDVSAWQTALAEYAGRADALQRMGERARQHMEASFDRRRYAPRMLELYQAALSEPLIAG
jgi:glycosyltransferase involved in cell wall biosynthesis